MLRSKKKEEEKHFDQPISYQLQINTKQSNDIRKSIATLLRHLPCKTISLLVASSIIVNKIQAKINVALIIVKLKSL